MINIPCEMPTSRFQVLFVYRERRYMLAEKIVVHKNTFACNLLLIEIYIFYIIVFENREYAREFT